MDTSFETDKRFAPKIKVLTQPGKSKARKDAYFYIHEHLLDNESDLRKFYTTYFKFIWEVQAEEWSQYLAYMANYGNPQMKCKPNDNLVIQLIDMIEFCVKYCFSQFNKVTSPEFLHTMTVLVQIAHTKNMRTLRQKGFRIALQLLYQHRDADHLFEVLMYIFDFAPFVHQGQNVRLKYDHESKDRANGLLVPKPTGQVTTKEETLEFLTEWFKWIEDQNDFHHWFGMIKKFLFVFLFPEVTKRLNIKPSHDDTGFPVCPPELQEFLTTKYHQWYQMNPKLWAILWSTDENQEVVMELLRQSTKLEVVDLPRQTKIFNLFFENLVLSPLRIISHEKLLEHQTTFFTVLPNVFDAKHLSDDATIISNMITYFKRCGEAQIWNNLDKAVRNTLQKSFLNMSVLILTPTASQNVNSLDNVLCPKLLEIIFHLWIYTQETEFDQWFYLQDRLRTMFHRPKAVEIIQTKILQVSYHYIHEFLYDFKAFDQRYERIINSSKKGGLSLAPDGHKNNLKKQDPLQSITPWTYETLTAIWNYVFDILRYTNMEVLVQVKGEAVVIEICRCFKQVVYMFVIAEELGAYEDVGMYHKLDIVAAFVLWLWRHTTGLPGLCIGARKQAYLALCRLFCRKSQYTFPVHLLTKFYDTLDYGLNFHKKPLPQGYAQTQLSSTNSKSGIVELLAYTIFESTINIFSLGLPGADILIPAYLVEISQMFSSKNKISPRTSERALLLVGSLVSYSRHFSFMPDIPTSEHVLAFLDIKLFICDIIEGRITHYQESQDLKEAHYSLSILAVILLEEIHYQTPDFEFFVNKLACIVNQVRFTSPASFSALMALETISLYFPLLAFYDMNIPVSILKDLCGILIDTIGLAKDELKTNLILAIIETIQNLVFALPLECFAEELGVMRALCDVIGTLTASKNNFFQMHGRELANNVLNYLHNFPPEGHYDINASTTMEDADQLEILWASVGDYIYSAQDVAGANHELLSPTLLYWVMHCISHPQQGQVTHRRLAYFFAPYLSAKAPSLISVWCYLDTVGPHFLEDQLNFIGETIRAFFTGADNQGLYNDGAPPPTFPGGPQWSIHDFMQLKNEMIQLIAVYYNEFSLTREYALALNTASRITTRDATGTFCWDMELNHAGYPRWAPQKGVVENFGGPPTRVNWSPAPENLPQIQEPVLPSKIKLQSTPSTRKLKWPPSRPGMKQLTRQLDENGNEVEVETFIEPEPEPTQADWENFDRMAIENDPRNGPNRITVPLITQTLTSERFFTLSEIELALVHQFKETNYPTPPKETPQQYEIQSEEFHFVDVHPDDNLDSLCPIPPVPDITHVPSTEGVHSLQNLIQYTQASVLNYEGGAVEWGCQEYNRDNFESQDAISQLLVQMQRQEQSNAEAVEIHRGSQQVLDLHTAQPPNPVHPIGPLSHSRTLYANLGWFTYEACKDNFVFLNHLESASNFKHIKGLDSIKGREVVKCGLLYVAHGQQDEKEILKNDAYMPSGSYHEFVKALGPIVDVQASFGYMGGLEKYSKDQIGSHTPYYATPLVEFVIHEAVRMPNLDDPISEHKKRHIGNEYVHIVWTEHVSSYLPWTVISQFNSCHIVIYPLPNGLFKVQVAKKPEIPSTAGPLIHNMVLHKQLLGPLVRQTAINMNKLARICNKQNEDPYLIRAEKLGIVINKCCMAGKFHDMLALTLSRLPQTQKPDDKKMKGQTYQGSQ